MARKKFHIIATIKDKRGRVLSVGYNSYSKTHPVQKMYADMCGLPHKVYLHAEISAILKLKQPWKAYSIHVERYDSEGNPVNAKPCVICQKAIEAAGITNVEWTK